MKSITRKLALLCSLALLCGLASPASAAGEIHWALGSDEKLIGLAQSLPAPETSTREHGLVELKLHVDVLLTEEFATQRTQRILYFGNDEAVSSYGTNTVSWNAAGEDIRFLEATVIAPDGSRSDFDPTTVQVLDTNSYEVFTDYREIAVILPNLAVNSIVVLSYERIINLDRPYFFSAYLQSRSPRKSFSFRLESKTSLPQWHTDDSLMSCTETATTLVCDATDLPPVLFDDSVHYADVLPRLTISAYANWDQVIASVASTIEAAVSDSARLAELTAELRRNHNFTNDAHDFVARQVRYVSMSQGANATAPHHIDRTIESLYGDCKDKSVLLYALFRSVGIKTYPVLVATDRTKPAQLAIPGSGYFDHMVLCTQGPRGEHCFDPTDAYTDAQTIPAEIQGKVRLKLVSGSKPSTIPKSKFRWTMKVENGLEFDEAGGQTESLRRTYFGEYASLQRARFEKMTPKERDEDLHEEYDEVVSDSAEASFKPLNFGSLKSSLQITSEAIFDPFLEPDKETSYSDFQFWLRTFIANFRNNNRHYDYQFPGVSFAATYRYSLGGHWLPRGTGATFNYATKYGNVRRRYSQSESTIVVETHLEMPARDISVDEKEQFNRFIDYVATDSMIRFGLIPKSRPDTPL